MKKLIIIPAYNEEENILTTVKSLEAYTDYDYIVINDGSTDKTAELLKQNKIPHITLIKNLGIGGAMQTGYRYAYEKNYDIAIQLDADGQHDPAYLDTLCHTLADNNSDMVIGSRFITKEGFQSSFARRIGKSVITIMIKLLTRKTITDPTSGFRAGNKKLIELFAHNYPIDYPEPDTVTAILAKKFSVYEIPVVMREREKGQSSITPVKSVYYMIKVCLAIIFSFFNNRKKVKL